MMKKIIFILLLSITAIACKKDDEALFSIFTNIVRVDADRETYSIWVKNSSNWTVEIPADAQSWLSFQKDIKPNAIDTCVLVFKQNNTLTDRSAAIKIRDLTTDKLFDVDVKQAAQAPRFYFSPARVVLKSEDTQSTLLLTLNADSYTMEYKPEWVSDVDVANTGDEYKKDIKLTLQANRGVGFREDSVVYNVKWGILNKTTKVSLKIFQLGTGSVESDKVNLTAIYNKMGGAAWASDYRWDLSADIKTWKGVTVADVGNGAGERVVGLQLSGVGLVGEIPVEIVDLSYLKVLWLDKNSGIMGSIPTNLGDLLLMENLRFGDTSIKGTLPVSISKMKNLFSLSINNTGDSGVGGSFPAEYSKLTNLVALDLSNNNLSGALPEAFGSLKSLQNINISKNDFSGVIPKTYLNNYMWAYWNIEVNVCPQRGSGFTNCSL